MYFYQLLFGMLALVAFFGLFSAGLMRTGATLATVIVAFLAFKRGYVGTDTYSYVSITQAIQLGARDELPVEPGYIWIVRAVTLFTDDPLVAVAAISAASALVFALAVFVMPADMANPVVPLYLTYFLLDNTFNGLRVGLATGLILLGFGLWERKRYALAALAVIVAIGIQFTTAVIPILFLFRRLQARRSLFFPMIVLAATIMAIYSSRIEEKFLLYSTVQEQKGWSGLSLAAIALLLLAIGAVNSNVSWYETAIVAAILACTVPNQYGFLTIRIAQLLVVYLAIEIGARMGEARRDELLNTTDRRTATANKVTAASVKNTVQGGIGHAFLYSLLVVGAAFLRYRNIVAPLPGELSAYLPYYFR